MTMGWAKHEQLEKRAGVLFEREKYFIPALSPEADYEKSKDGDVYKAPKDEKFRIDDNNTFFNALSSSLVSAPGLHAPTLDVDHQCRLIPSSTPGHWHLYIEVAMPWRKYRRLLKALWKAGIIEEGYYRASKRRRASFLRKPNYFKEEMARADQIDELAALRDRLRRRDGTGARATGPRSDAGREQRNDRAADPDDEEPF